MSTDPALGEYVPEEGKGNTNDSANLPGMGGVYNVVNFNLYHYGANNPVKYVDPDGKQVAVPWVIPKFVPWTLPKVTPIPLPGEFCPFPMVPNINSPHYSGGIDWSHAPKGPDMNDPNSNPLGSNWEKEPGSDKDPTGKHRFYRNKETDERVRWDDDEGHWHRLNPDKTDKKHPYLDDRGNPVKRDSPKGHIKPNPVPPLMAEGDKNEEKNFS